MNKLVNKMHVYTDTHGLRYGNVENNPSSCSLPFRPSMAPFTSVFTA